MNYEIFYFYSAKKEFYKLDRSIILQILKKIKELKCNRFLGKPLSNTLKHIRSLHVGNYRIIYSIREKDRKIIILKIGHRKNVYSIVYDLDFENNSKYNNLVKSGKQKIFYDKINTIKNKK
jgi:mRNA interferase RelE/StbE